MAQVLADRAQRLFGDIDQALASSPVKERVLDAVARAVRDLRDAEPDDAEAEAAKLAGDTWPSLRPVERQAWIDLVHARAVAAAEVVEEKAREEDALARDAAREATRSAGG